MCWRTPASSGGFGPNRKELVRSLRLALEHMSVAARTDDMDALVASDTHFHELLIDVSGRRRLKDLWSMLNSQMGALMRAEIERQGISLLDAVERHRAIVDAVSDGDVPRLRAGDPRPLPGRVSRARRRRERGPRAGPELIRPTLLRHDLGVVQVAGDRAAAGQLDQRRARAPGTPASPSGSAGGSDSRTGRSIAFGMSPVRAGFTVLRCVVSRGAARTSAWV